MGVDWPARVLAEVDGSRDDMLGLLQQLVRIPSVGGSDAENEAQHWLSARMNERGLETDLWQVPLDQVLTDPGFPGTEVVRSEAWGLVGRLPGRGARPVLMFDGHIDVVPAGPDQAWADASPFSGRVRGDHLFGRGACDMKAGLVAALWAVEAVRRAGVPLMGHLVVASVQAEEDGGLGTFAMLQRGWRADACVVPEPTGLDVVPANAGALTFRLRVPGRATHASQRYAGVSAIEKFWPVWQVLAQLEQARNLDPDPLVARWPIPYPISLGRVSGGVWASSVPDSVVAEGRMGVRLGEPVQQARRELEEAVASVCRADGWLRDHPVEVQWWGGQFAPGRLPDGHPLLRSVLHAHEAATGRSDAQVWGAPYGSDLRLLQAAGVPTVQYGPGDIALAHAVDERVPLREVAQAARTFALLALDLCAGDAGRRP